MARGESRSVIHLLMIQWKSSAWVQAIDGALLASLTENDDLDVPLVIGLHYDARLSLAQLDQVNEACLPSGFEYVALDAKLEPGEEDQMGAQLELIIPT
jgi:hypothetical protein